MQNLSIFCQFLIAFSFIVLLVAKLVHANNTTVEPELAAIDNLLKSYDKRIRPYNKVRPVVVTCQVTVLKFHPLQYEGIFTVDIFLRFSWNDPRLKHNDTTDIIFPGESSEKFWHPDVYFANGLKASKHSVLMANRFFRLSPNGAVLTSNRLTVQSDCYQYLLQYPFDVQLCNLIIESYAYTTEEIVLKWPKTAAVILSNRNMKQFVVENARPYEKNCSYFTGSFSQAIIEIKFERRIGYYIFQVFIPCNLVVILSFVAFWMNPEDVGDRIALGITTVLTIVFLMESINNHIPKVSYVKAIDVYLIGCFLLVFATVLETVLAFSCIKKAQEKPEKECHLFAKCTKEANIKVNRQQIADREKVIENVEAVMENNEGKHREISNAAKSMEDVGAKKRTIYVDACCKIAFPALFLTLNAVYWLIMLWNRQ